ncbi:MAG: cytochrome c3 family protein [Acidobacteria bacterium]|nr:cytochrome c3 family protein [Acidobacteriota bacterium]
MKLKFIIVALYLVAFVVVVQSSARSNAALDATQQSKPVPIQLDAQGQRGLVVFDHKKHEALLNPDATFKHKARPNLACIGCHHTVKEVTDLKQFQNCTDCHKDIANDKNPDDADSIDLNRREIYHRLCISCHRATDFRASNYRIQNSKFTKCSECHDRGNMGSEMAQVNDEQAPFLNPNEEIYPPRSLVKNYPAPGEVINTAFDPPIGYAGKSRIEKATSNEGDKLPVTDRWRIGFPEDPRYKKGSFFNPYRQNVLKGDYPIFRQHNFLVLNLESETLINGRRIPVPSGVSSERSNSAEFFGRGGQLFTRQNFSLSVELFNGDASFKPVDWRVRFTPNFNINYLNTQERNLVNINPLIGTNRFDSYIGFQEMFFEKRLGDTTNLLPFFRKGSKTDKKGFIDNKKGESAYFDTTFIRAGIQQFNSDFRGFIFNDFNLGARLFGQASNNRYNFNSAYFYMLEKDTNSELNTRINRGEFRNQTVFIGNLYRQDTIWKGYTAQFSFHYNNDRPSRRFDENDFLVRPALIGDVAMHGIKAIYLGFTGDGHIGLLNINHAFYQVLGHDTRNPIAGRRTRINAQMAALELSRDRDWLRFKGSIFFASGDSKPFDGTARGFDSIVDTTEFAGGKFSFWNSQAIPFTNTGVLLTTPESLLPSLRSSKFEGQSNFVNPGILVYNAGLEAELTPKLRGIVNANYSHFHHTETLSELLFQPQVHKSIGFDYGLGVIFRPMLSENIIVAGGFTSLVPGRGFKDIFSSNCAGQGCGANPKTLYSAFVKLKFVY